MKELKSISGRIIHSGNFNTFKELVVDANLRGANLRGANLRCANLRGANLSDANLRGADLSDAYLSNANLSDANLRGADLSDAYLSNANLRGANLRGADLSDAYLSDANLRGADLRGAYLSNANLRGAYLRGANLRCAYRCGFKVKLIENFINLYKYDSELLIGECGTIKIKMGCHTRTLDEWERNFWNNDSEFPNDGSFESNRRLSAYQFIKCLYHDLVICGMVP